MRDDSGADGTRPRRGRVLIAASAFLWGLQFSFLNPALALLLVSLYGVNAAEVGGILVVYNIGGFLAAVALPAYADRRSDYLRPMLACAVLAIGLAAVLALTNSVPVAIVALLFLGGPAGVGSTLLFAQLKHAGADRADIVNTRALISFAWVGGPSLASFVIDTFGNRSILAAIAAVALVNVATTGVMLTGPRRQTAPSAPEPAADPDQVVPRAVIVLIAAAFVLLQGTNNAAMSVMYLFVSHTLGLRVVWAGVALSVAAAAEVPSLLLIGRLSSRVSDLTLVIWGCAAGATYYAAITLAKGPVALVGLQVLNAIFVAAIAGVGITLFQRIVARPGLASGMYANTRRVGSILSGPLIGLASVSSLGYASTFAASAGLTVVAILILALAARRTSGAGAQRPRILGPGPLDHEREEQPHRSG